MNDPQVESLEYLLNIVDETISNKAPPLTYETDKFSLHLESDKLLVNLHQHFATVKEARNCVEEFLRAWEVKVALQSGKKEFFFQFVDASVIDRAPSDSNNSTVDNVVAAKISMTALAVKESTERKKYPEPPRHFHLSPDAETLWNRYERYKQGREPLFSMAYFCLKLLETRGSEFVKMEGNSKKKAAKKYNVSKDVLKELGKLSAERGSEETARKYSPNLKPATAAEKRWTEKAICAIIKQVGIYDGGNTPEKLTMSDLPKLE